MFDVSLSALATVYLITTCAGILLVVLVATLARRRTSRPGPPSVRCRLCAFTFEPTKELTPCPRCGSLNEAPVTNRTKVMPNGADPR